MISVVVLAYNEEASLRGLLTEVSRHLEGRDHRFFVVDDGSRDRTADAAREAARELPVTLLQHPANYGVGRAFDTGLRRAARDCQADDYIVTMEGDKTNDPACVPLLARKLEEGFDVVCASRYQAGGAYVGFPLLRWFFSIAANMVTRRLFSVPGIKDYTLFFRAYRAGALQRAISRYGDRFIECPGFASNCEILLKTHRAGPIRCAEIPTVYRYDLKRGKSKMKIGKNLLEYFRLYRASLSR